MLQTPVAILHGKCPTECLAYSEHRVDATVISYGFGIRLTDRSSWVVYFMPAIVQADKDAMVNTVPALTELATGRGNR